MEEIKTAKCTAKTVRVTPRKARLVIDLVRGKSASEASATMSRICAIKKPFAPSGSIT